MKIGFLKDRISIKDVIIRTTSRLAVMHTNSVNGKMYKTDVLELKIDKNTSKIGGRRRKNIRSGKTDPVQFTGVFKQGPFCL